MVSLAAFLKYPSLSRVALQCFSVACGQKGVAKIYFAASIRAGRTDAGIYHELIDYIKVHGQVMSESEQRDPEVDQGTNDFVKH